MASRVVSARIDGDQSRLVDLSTILAGKTVADLVREGLLERVEKLLGIPPEPKKEERECPTSR